VADAGELTEALGVLQPTNLCETRFDAIVFRQDVEALLDRVRESSSIPSTIRQEFVAAAPALLEHLQA
jgi:predicted patatin/cPLA2 family phospholipase